jgi:uncharacterized protein
MSKDLIRYDLLVQDALKGVVRKVLGDAARDGLPGDHHFYVSFRTDFPGVRLSSRLREKYPEDMTIVLQHQFWDLAITEQSLEVGLSFSGVPERLFIPLDAVTGFFDPSVQFGLKFELEGEADDAAGEDEKPAKPPSPAAVELQKKPSVPVTRTAPKVPSKQAKPESDRAAPKSEKGPKVVKVDTGKDKTDDAATAEVVSLDAFRKKN